MKVDHAEGEFAGDHKADRADGGHTYEATSVALRGLEQPIESFQEAVGLARLCVRHDALPMVTRERDDFLHGLDLGAHHAATPVLKHGAHDFDLLALGDLAQLLVVDPGAGSAQRGQLGDQGIRIASGLNAQVGAILERRSAHALERAVGGLLGAAHLVPGAAGVPENVELVESDACVRQKRLAALDQRRQHVDVHQAGLLDGTTAVLQPTGQRFDGLHTAAFGDGELAHFGEIGLRQCQFDVALIDRGYPVAAFAHQAVGGSEAHLLAEHEHLRLEQQREAEELAGPRRLDLTCRALEDDSWKHRPGNLRLRAEDRLHAPARSQLRSEVGVIPVALRRTQPSTRAVFARQSLARRGHSRQCIALAFAGMRLRHRLGFHRLQPPTIDRLALLPGYVLTHGPLAYLHQARQSRGTDAPSERRLDHHSRLQIELACSRLQTRLPKYEFLHAVPKLVNRDVALSVNRSVPRTYGLGQRAASVWSTPSAE